MFRASHDWETVTNVLPGNSSSKPDRTDRDRKVAKQSKMLNNSAYSTLGNKTSCSDQKRVQSTLSVPGESFVSQE